MISKIKALAKAHKARIIQIRRHLHMHPELSFVEHNTAEYVKSILDVLGIDYQDGLGSGTGITGVIGQGDHTIALRADMDALPIQEESDVEYRSVHDGVMHACGHDVHTASLLGTLMILRA
jgi:amidohydrolase